MKILICSYQDLIDGTTDYAVTAIHKHLPEAEIVIKPYVDNETLIADLKDVDGLLTYFIPIDDSVLSSAKSLKILSISSTGFSNVDLASAERNGIKVCSIKEYCTNEVADHTVSLMLCLERKLLQYNHSIKVDKLWDYEAVGPIKRLSEHVLGIYGFGRIGQAVAKRARAFGMKVLAADPYVSSETAAAFEVELVASQTIQKHATIISNHMNASDENYNFFNLEYFKALKRQPVFINVSRGASVDEDALLFALDHHLVSSAALDVFKSEAPELSRMPLVSHARTLLSPHAAFYSEEAIHDCDHISVMNLIYSLKGEHEKVFSYLIQ